MPARTTLICSGWLPVTVLASWLSGMSRGVKAGSEMLICGAGAWAAARPSKAARTKMRHMVWEPSTSNRQRRPNK